MDKQHNQSSGGSQQNQNAAGRQTGSQQEENVQISQPRIDRPEGPFEHSGETFNWTKEEREEKEKQDDAE
ncbi:MAG TPA: hypothetical protein VMR70_08425 [Flavisolibacter sp.]|nr:hypothetical protein [Flavisolibacter sp.]